MSDYIPTLSQGSNQVECETLQRVPTAPVILSATAKGSRVVALEIQLPALDLDGNPIDKLYALNIYASKVPIVALDAQAPFVTVPLTEDDVGTIRHEVVDGLTPATKYFFVAAVSG